MGSLMHKVSYFKLKCGGSGSRVSDVPEPDETLLYWLKSKWNDRLEWVKVDGRILELNEDK